MEGRVSKLLIACVVGFALVSWAGGSLARDYSHYGNAPDSQKGQEVVAGNYRCSGSTYTDEDHASVGSEFWFSCQGTRDAIFGVIGTLGRLTLSVQHD